MNDETDARTLEALLADMDVPPVRRGDMHWLMRNLAVRNADHPNFAEAMRQIKLQARRTQ